MIESKTSYKSLIKTWYLKKGLDFLKTRTFKDSEEKLLEEFTNFCLEDLD